MPAKLSCVACAVPVNLLGFHKELFRVPQRTSPLFLWPVQYNLKCRDENFKWTQVAYS